MRKATDAELVGAYRELRSVWKVGERFGMVGQSVHERLARLGENRSINYFTADDDERLLREYVIYRDAGRLRDMAADMGRTVPFLARHARRLGLTDRKRPATWNRVWKGLSADAARVMWEDFKGSSLGLTQYCAKKGYDDLGFARTMRGHFADEWEHVIELKQSKQTHYRLGRQFEYAVRDHLKACGYFVLRSPQSRSPVDLVAVRAGSLLFVQCKRSGALGVEGWNELYDLATGVHARPVLAERPAGRGSLCYWLLTGRKDGSKRRQPRESFLPDSALPQPVWTGGDFPDRPEDDPEAAF